jgi:hypothetical protein
MPYADKEKQKEYQRIWYTRRRQQWIEENGPCKECGSKEKLEVHHKDPSKKISHNVWSWKEERRLKELAKCEVLCKPCHDVKRSKITPEGTAWCPSCQEFVSLELFGKNYRLNERRPVRSYCNPCRRKRNWDNKEIVR